MLSQSLAAAIAPYDELLRLLFSTVDYQLTSAQRLLLGIPLPAAVFSSFDQPHSRAQRTQRQANHGCSSAGNR